LVLVENCALLGYYTASSDNYNYMLHNNPEGTVLIYFAAEA